MFHNDIIQYDKSKDTYNVSFSSIKHSMAKIDFITQVHFTRHPWQAWLQNFKMASISDYLDDIMPFFPNFGLVFITVIMVVKVLIFSKNGKVIKKKVDDIIYIHPLLSYISIVQSLTCSHDFRKCTENLVL